MKESRKLSEELSIFRNYPLDQAIIKMLDLRSEVASKDYQALTNAFVHSARKRQSGLTRKIKSYGELYWLPPAPRVGLVNEFKWARVWLAPISRTLTNHASRLQKMERCFNEGDLNTVDSLADEDISECGWSFWAAGLKLAALSACGDSSSVSELSSLLRKEGAGRVSGLLARMSADRNDPTIPYGSFEARCKEFLDRVEDPSRRAVYSAKALGLLDDEDQADLVLAHEASSSYIDYYESIVQVALVSREENDTLWPDLRQELTKLSDAGIADVRIEELLADDDSAHAGKLPPDEKSLIWRCTSLGAPAPESTEVWISTVHRAISVTDSDGLSAADEIEELMRVGVNFQGLPSGRAIWAKGIQPFVPIESMAIFAGGISARTRVNPQYPLLIQKDSSIIAKLGGSKSDDLKGLLEVVEGRISAYVENPPQPKDVWLARYLAQNGRPEEALIMAREMRKHGGVWERYGAKIEVIAHVALDRTEDAMRVCARQISFDSRLAYELPLSMVLDGKAWRELSHLPSWMVAYIAHFANHLKPSSKTRFICRMACRQLYLSLQNSTIDGFINSLRESDRGLFFKFMRLGWVDENLSFVDALVSTQDVRRDRINLFQHLLNHDEKNAETYRGLIQTLTLDETLWSGLREIDSNRVFVNEPAITRWAEKELLPEYERWKAMKILEASSDVRLDKILRAYLMDNDINALLMSLPASEQSEVNATMLGIVTKLFSRFLIDPANGLNSYLSLRVRHGTLRGVLLGPIEEERLLLTGEYSSEEFEKRWRSALNITNRDNLDLQKELHSFGTKLDQISSSLVNEKIQVWSEGKPEGMFASRLESRNVSFAFSSLEPSMSFPFFVNQCYMFFWEALVPSRNSISEFFLNDVSKEFQDEFQTIIGRLNERFGETAMRPLTTSLQALATRSRDSCRIVAEWFLPVAPGDEQTYPVTSALEIARTATSNVYREFQVELQVEGMGEADIGLSTSGLSILYDGMFVIFSNAWVHSGLGSDVGKLSVCYFYHSEHQVLSLRVENDLAEERRRSLVEYELSDLHSKYLTDIPLELVPVEGGSGFAKLARVAAAVQRSAFSKPLDFGITDEGRFFVEVKIQLYKRDGVFDAYL